MSAAGTTEIPDLDTLINAAENRSGESSGEGNHSDKGAFDPDEYAGVVQWYNEQSKNLQRHYEMHLEHQKQKLAEENEAGLLEALQQSLNNFESDHMSDFASLSSSLDNACAHLNPSSLESSIGGSEKQSMLKELLLSPFSENYSREIDSPEHVAGDLNKSGSSSPENCSPSHGRLAKKLKPFAELLKHMEAAENDTKMGKIAKSKQSGTRLVNTKRYMSKYATADKKDSPPKDLKSNAIGKRIVLHPMKNSNGMQNCKTLTFSLKPNSVANFVNTSQTPETNPFSTSPHSTTSAKVTPIFSTSSPSLKTVTITSGKLAEKRAATLPVSDQLPLKKQCISTCANSTGQSVDHDYCTSIQQSNINSVSTEPPKDCNNFTPPESPKSQKSASQKVLKWDDYLEQVRAGVRSAPNSPTSSPKVARGSARKPVNNFMVVSLQGSQIPPAIVVNSVAGKSKVNKNVPLPEPLRKTAIKQTFGLQEFDKYLTVLQKNLNPNTSKTTKIDPTSEKINPTNNTNGVKSENSNVDPFSATQSLAAMVQRQQSEVLQKNEKIASSSNPQVPKTQNVPQNTVKKTQKFVPTSGSSGQLLMIQVPVTSATAQRSSSRKTSPVKAAISVSPSTPSSVPKVAQTSPTKPVSTVASSTAQPAPTFKLMTSNKDGAEAKSLILSGVTGKLKDILTLMAEQQAKSKTENTKQEVVSNEQQLVTLQKLISCLSTQQSLKSGTAEPSNSPQLDKPEKEPGVTHRKTAVNVPADSTLTPLVTNVRTLQSLKEENMNLLPRSEKITDTVLSASEFAQNPGAEKNIEHCLSEISVVDTMPENTVFVENDTTNHSKILESKPLILTPQSELVQETVPKQDNLVSAEKVPEVAQPPLHPFVVDSSEKQVRDDTGEDSSPKFSMTRSMAAAEMLAADVVDDGTEEIMVYSKPEEKAGNLDANNNEIGAIEDNDPAVITLEEAMEKLEDDELMNQDNLRTTSLAAADNLFCKLPSYFLTGKLVGEQGKTKENIEGLKQRGMKNVLCDPLISSKGNDVEYNKLPHYFSSGKFSRPNSPRQNGQRSSSTKNICQGNDFAVKLQPVGSTHTQHLTPQGTPVNQAETYYSKLPSYYTYGRPHPAVKTFNDDVADAKDDTVTSETLAADKHRQHSKRKHKAKKQKKKHKRASKRDRTPEKILYSKLPSYYLSGRILSNHEKVKTQRLSPHRRSSIRSPSPHSMSYSSRSSQSRSRSRSPLRRSRSRRRYLSRSYSRSMSRSSSGSEGESQRSWRSERRSIRNRRERSFDRRSYDTSDEDRDEYIWRREREARRANTQHQDAMESERQRAMEERRVVYVGGVDEKISKQELRRKFLRFGNIETVSLHFRNDGDNYGFLTFQYTSDAFRAIEEGGNLGPGEPRYDLCFGGRRQFCKTVYEDLDSKVAKEEAKAKELNDFDALLQQARRSLRR